MAAQGVRKCRGIRRPTGNASNAVVRCAVIAGLVDASTWWLGSSATAMTSRPGVRASMHRCCRTDATGSRTIAYASDQHRAPKGPWHIFGLPPTATQDQVKSRFHELVRQHHPDRPGGSHELLRDIISAAEALLKGSRGKPPLAQKYSAATRQGWRRRRQEQAEEEQIREDLIYHGLGRMHKGIWPIYKITTLRIMIHWQLDRHSMARKDRARNQEVSFADVRNVTGLVKLPSGDFDVMLALATRAVLRLQQIPLRAVQGIQGAVKESQLRFQARRAEMLKRV